MEVEDGPRVSLALQHGQALLRKFQGRGESSRRSGVTSSSYYLRRDDLSLPPEHDAHSHDEYDYSSASTPKRAGRMPASTKLASQQALAVSLSEQHNDELLELVSTLAVEQRTNEELEFKAQLAAAEARLDSERAAREAAALEHGAAMAAAEAARAEAAA
ncbi:unnamed protein product, partial [Phaeothamnion confervicola]